MPRPFGKRALLILLPACIVGTAHLASAGNLLSHGGIPDHFAGANGIDSGTDGTCVNRLVGGAWSTEFSSPSAKFCQRDVGKTFVVTGDSEGKLGGAFPDSNPPDGLQDYNNAPLITKVEAILNDHTVRLADRCSDALPNAPANGRLQWDIGTDNTAALQSCVKSGQCIVPVGRYLVSGHVVLPSNSTLLCDPASVFFFPRHDNRARVDAAQSEGEWPNAMLELVNAENAVVAHCTFVGTNLHRAFTPGYEYNSFIAITGASRNNFIYGNVISNGWSDGDVLIAGNPTGSPAGAAFSNNIQYNTISNCGFNGITITSGIDNLVHGNTLIDCSIDIEPEEGQNVSGNAVAGNVVRRVGRPGSASCPAGICDDETGQHRWTMFSSCFGVRCEGAGAASISVMDNAFYGEVEIVPFCGQSQQTWINNAMALAGGARCLLGSPGCSFVPEFASACSPPPAAPTYRGQNEILNALISN